MSIPPIPEGMNKGVIEDAANRLNSLSIHLVRRLSRVNIDDGLTPARLSLMSVIVFGGVSTVSELARAENVSAPAITRMLDALENDGFVYRDHAKDDRRVVRVHPTDEGKALMETARARRVQRVVDELRFLSEGELGTLLKAVTMLEHL